MSGIGVVVARIERWRRPGLRALILAAALAVSGATGVLAAPPAECTVPEDLLQNDAKLPHLRERLRAGGPVKIVAIGSASTTGAAAGSVDLAYPHRLEEVLARWFPTVPITVVNKAVARQSAQQMLARFPSDVYAEDPVLVIWETGTNEAVRGTNIEEFAAALQSGIDGLKARGVDIMLIDMQYSRSTTTVIDFERYLATLHHVAEANELYVVPRFEMMKYWSEKDLFNFDDVQKDERAGLAARVYSCIGRKLADIVKLAIQ